MTKWQSLCRLSRMIAAALLFVVTIEVGTRVGDRVRYGAPFFGNYEADRLRAKDADGLAVNVPNANFEKWRINSLGFRGPEIRVPKADGVIRVVCLGVSETFGLFESPNKEWPAQLQKMLNAQGSFEVINVSVVGLSLRDYLPYLRRYVMYLKPDVVILLANPFHELARILREADCPSRGVTKRPATPVSRSRMNLRILHKLEGVLTREVPLRTLQTCREWKYTRRITEQEHIRLKGRRPFDQISSVCVDRFRSGMQSLLGYLSSSGVHVIVGSYPMLLSEDNLLTQRVMFLASRQYIVELSCVGMLDAARRFNEIMEEVACDMDVDFVNSAEAVPNTLTYFGDAVHYTDAGAQRVANVFAACLVQIYGTCIGQGDRHEQRSCSNRSRGGML